MSDASYLGEKSNVSHGEGAFIDLASLHGLECGTFSYYQWLLLNVPITSCG
jgi:hypothetical protein